MKGGHGSGVPVAVVMEILNLDISCTSQSLNACSESITALQYATLTMNPVNSVFVHKVNLTTLAENSHCFYAAYNTLHE